MVASYGEQMQQLSTQLMSGTPDSARQRAAYEQMARIEYEMGQKVVEMTEKNLDNELGYFLALNYINDQVLPAEKRLELIDKLPESYRQRAAVALVRKELQQASQPAPGEGAKFGDYTLPTPDGGTLNLTEEVARHRYTVIDFWASWCGPCMREMPHMKQLYAKYGKKGVGMIGISLDDDRDAWVKAIGEKQIPWLHVSDLQGWKCQPARDLGVEAIPCIYVLDQQGTIVAARLMGDDLEKFLEQAFSTQQ
jgi:thiol-disulfide isomerase/thioredoxin